MKSKWIYTADGVVDISEEESFVVCTPRTDGKHRSCWTLENPSFPRGFREIWPEPCG